ncbi:ITG-like peptide [Ischnura elegans]|uniref:ITG-like peptide n=1 Tax=Ischnura elegans TaxID=197161 RepID=UPI001ED8B4C9|nr:ITG-like peptide [Ischnura elegans]
MRRGALGAVLLVVLGAAGTARAWGGLFNRFSPEVLSNLGYGGGGGGGGHRVSAAYGAGNGLSFGGGVFRAAPPPQQMHPLDLFDEDDVREADADDGTEECYGRKCTSNEHCCPGSICVDMDGIVGSCLLPFGLRQGELCRRDGDCESGLLCAAEDDDVIVGRVVSAAGSNGEQQNNRLSEGVIRTCQPPSRSRKLYGEDCLLSSECDVSKGLCCQLQRRHRQAPRKVCSYFKDSLTCIGAVAEERVKESVRHTAGEKRITGKAGSFGRIRK